MVEIATGPACAPLANRLRAAIQEATTRDADGAAWALRRAFDEILASASRRDAR